MNSCRLGSSSYALGVHSFFLSLYCCSNFRKNELECNGRQEGYSRRAIVCSVHGLIVTDRTRRSGDCWERTSCWLRRGQLSCTGGWGNQTKPLRGTPSQAHAGSDVPPPLSGAVKCKPLRGEARLCLGQCHRQPTGIVRHRRASRVHWPRMDRYVVCLSAAPSTCSRAGTHQETLTVVPIACRYGAGCDRKHHH